MRLTEAFDYHTNPDANPDQYTHFDPTLSCEGRAFDCGENLLSTAAVADALEHRAGLCESTTPAIEFNGKGKQ